MDTWYLLCFLSATAILVAFANQFFLNLQTTIAITSGAVVISLLLILAVKVLGNQTAVAVSDMLSNVDFKSLLLEGMLGPLLFAGALEIDLRAMRRRRWEITILVLFGTLASTFLVGLFVYWIMGLMGWNVPFIYCLLFGALISPTDPIAVLAIIKQMKAPPSISIQVEGESLFNDGVGLVVFTTILTLAFSHTEPTFANVADLFLTDALGGIAFGMLLAVIGHFLLVKSEDGNIRLLLTFCIPTAGFALANIIDVSGALAMVVSGIFLGNVTRAKAASMARLSSIRNIRNFWHAVDGVLNAFLFLLIGLLVVTLPVTGEQILLGLLAVPAVLLARFISVSLPYLAFRRFRTYDKHSVAILTWGGLRGGLALAMAASIPSHAAYFNGVDLHTLLLVITYIVVIFSIIVQGSSIKPLIRSSIAAQTNDS
ncbi:cation:proton antiporter [Marinobacter koreensis]|jgi:CPA1 family monovalent cation:H+ antiporter|uniref:Sodium/hydrogen exchanger n=2 Tax=Marinobacter TaxID=2742 RepID=M7DF03_9GAMM|nr:MULTISPECIES: sodium:proton antiporter [Marinobacter]EMP56252.1 sodium/hydrogen exchanger [Marinobacter santoriniensis NKSG1]MCK7546696.1 sodium:proton antiporter [Marinobacter koreensis]MDX1816687.1 sodium:proton antiporter [Marinobacter sp.]